MQELEAIKKRSVVGVIALTSRTLILQLINFFSTFLLTIFLAPEVFGVFFVVSAIVNFLNYFSDIGLAAALIQKKEEITQEDLKTTFTIQQILVLFLVFVSLFFSSKIALFYKLSSSGLWLLRALIISFFLSSLKTIPSILLERRLEFARLVIPQIAETLAFNLIAVVLAWKGLGVASFSWAVLTRGLVGLVLIYIISPWKPGFALERKSAKRLLSFGIPFQTNSFLALLKDDLLTVFLGKILPFSEIGFVGWAQKWANMPLRFIMDNVIKVGFPLYSRLQDNYSALKAGIEKAVFAVCFLTFPVLVGLSLLASPLVQFLPRYLKWQPALVSLYLFCGQAALACISTVLTNVLNATGRVKTTLKLMIFWTVLTWILTPFLVFKVGFNGVALAALLVSSTVFLPIMLVKKFINFFLWENAGKPFLGALGMGIVLKLIIPKFTFNLFSLAIIVIIGVVTYFFLMFALAKEKILESIKLVLRSFKE